MNLLGPVLRDLAPAVEYGWSGRLLVLLLMVGVPFLSLFQPDDREESLPPRQALYLSAILGVWILAALGGFVLVVEGIEPSRVGLQALGLRTFLAWTVLVTVGTLAGNFLISRGAARLGITESRLTYHLMPRNRRERWSFFAVSASAGFCEEFTYHGFLLAGVAAWLNNGWLAAVIANLAFGVLHGYQGHAGMIRAFLMGYVLCLPVIVGVGLWPAIAAHSLVNVLLGLGLWKWMVPEEEWRRVTGTSD